MNEGKIRDDIRNIREFLNENNLLKDYYANNCAILNYNTKYSKFFLDKMYHSDYKELYLEAINNFDYDILLTDDSFFQFGIQKSGRDFKLKFCYYPNPFTRSSYESFLLEHMLNDEKGFFFPEYEQYIDELEEDKTNKVVCVRYDYDNESYKKYQHPKSHLHFGNNSTIRIPTNYLFTPYLFVVMICMLFYPNEWNKLTINEKELKKVMKIKVNAISILEEDILDADEKKIIYMN